MAVIKKILFFAVFIFLISVYCKDQSEKAVDALDSDVSLAKESKPGVGNKIATGGDQGKATKYGEVKGKKKKNASLNIQANRKIIRSGNISLEVESVQDAVAQIDDLVESLDGYIQEESINRDYRDSYYGYLTVKVAPKNFKKFFHSAKKIGKVLNQSISSKDITKKYFDTEIRLENKKRIKKRLHKLLQTKTAKLKDILAVEEKLSRVTEEIEILKGELRYWDNLMALCTIKIHLREEAAIVTGRKESIFSQLVGSFVTAFYLLIDFISYFISSLGVIVPLGGLGYLGYLLVKKIREKRKKL
jgi:hypothetical protein